GLVLANMNTMALVKSAPRTNSDLASALAAYEHEELTIPSALDLATVPDRWSPRTRCISPRETKACTAPERPKPSTSAQNVSKNIQKPSARLLPTVSITSTCNRVHARSYFRKSVRMSTEA